MHEKNLNASLAAKTEQDRRQRGSEREAKLQATQEELSQVRMAASDLAKRLKDAEVAAPKIDASGRILASPFVSLASEFTEGISNARKLFTEGRLNEAYAIAERLTKKKEDLRQTTCNSRASWMNSRGFASEMFYQKMANARRQRQTIQP